MLTRGNYGFRQVVPQDGRLLRGLHVVWRASRAYELGSVVSYLDELGVPHAMTDATRAELLRIASQG